MGFHWDSNSVFARLLAKENISVVFDGAAKTASFDLKGRVLTLPNWDFDQDAVDAITSHEVSHAINTPLDKWVSSIDTLAVKHGIDKKCVQQYLNIVEDVRIEKLIKKCYPGLKRCYYYGYKKLYEKGILAVDKDVKISDMNLADRINMYYKVGHVIDVPFHDAEEKQLSTETARTETFEQVVDIADKLLKYEINKNGITEITTDFSELFSEFGEEGKDGNTAKNGGKSNKKMKKDGTYEDKSDSLMPTTQSNMDARLERKTAKTGTGKTYLLEPKTFDSCIMPIGDVLNKFKANDYNGSRFSGVRSTAKNTVNNSKDIISYMVQLFNRKKSARSHARTFESNTGMIDLKKLASISTRDDVFHSYRVVPKGKNHGIIMILDCSSSMREVYYKTMVQMINLALFCKKAGIPFISYGFFSGGNTTNKRNTSIKTTESFTNVELINSNMRSSDFSHQCENLLMFAEYCGSGGYGTKNLPTPPFSLSSTPMIGSLLALFNKIGDFKKSNNIEKMSVVVLTDGGNTDYMKSPDNNHVGENDFIKYGSAGSCILRCSKNVLSDTITLLKDYHHGIRVVGMFLCSDHHSTENEHIEQWKNNGFYWTQNEGFDKYFYMNTNMLTDSNEQTVERASQFGSMMTNKVKTKMFINSLMEYLA